MDVWGYQVLAAVFVIVCAIILRYIRRESYDDEEKDVRRDTKNDGVVHSEKKKDSTHSSKSKKKASDNRWSGRSDKQTFTHPWLLTTLKGHTGQVLDMEFSSNGKYLASCAEEDPDPGGELNGDASSEKENSTPSSADPSPRTKGLSRRQRKNRRREDASPPDNKKKTKPKRNKENMSDVSPEFYKLNVSERDFGILLRPYLLNTDQLLSCGYPIESSIFPGKAMIFKCPRGQNKAKPMLPSFDVNLDVNAREFVPCFSQSRTFARRGQGSGSSSDSGENLEDSEESGSGSEPEEFTGQASYSPSDNPHSGFSVERKCSRCHRGFFIVNDNEYLTQEKCVYHWGRLQNPKEPRMGSSRSIEYSCCGGKEFSRGCTTGKVHVWTGIVNGFNGPYDSFVKTKTRRRNPPPDGNFGVYGVDCEMCFTAAGLEVAKVTVVAPNGHRVYDCYVRPDNEIVDYNTRFSGISAKDFNNRRNTVKSLREVQNDLMGFIHAETILVGHGLENDLRALRIIHYACIDTAVTFPHFSGFKMSLKTLASNILQLHIQNSANGHNSYEDANTAMELMCWRVRQDVRVLHGPTNVTYYY